MTGIPKYSERTEKKREAEGRKAQQNNLYYVFYNANPVGVSVKTGNCAVRAIATAEDVDYRVAEQELLEHLTKIGYGYYAYADEDYLDAHYESITPKVIKGEKRMNGCRFAESHPKGRYVLNMAGHLTACIDGLIYDTWDCSRKCVYRYWKIKD